MVVIFKWFCVMYTLQCNGVRWWRWTATQRRFGMSRFRNVVIFGPFATTCFMVWLWTFFYTQLKWVMIPEHILVQIICSTQTSRFWVILLYRKTALLVCIFSHKNVTLSCNSKILVHKLDFYLVKVHLFHFLKELLFSYT